jgi:AcrR family transcriptional regulator
MKRHPCGQIAKNAGLDRRALYKHFGAKEEMFAALVEPVYQEMVLSYIRIVTGKHWMIWSRMELTHSKKMDLYRTSDLLRFIYQHFDAFQMMFNGSAGTRYETIREDMVEMEVESTKALMDVVQKTGLEIPALSEKEMHIFFTMSLTPLFEIITHGYPYEEAKGIVDLMSRGQNYAWERLIQLKTK